MRGMRGLSVGGVSAERLARRFGTPLYAYDGDLLRARLSAFRRAFAGRDLLVCYALKANPLGAVARLLAREGAGCDVVSGGELGRALAAGFAPSRVVFSGVGKTEEEIVAGLRRGLYAFNVESADELRTLERAARRLKRPGRFAVRVTPGVKAGGHAHIETGSADTKFGVEPREALELCRKSRRSRFLRLVGLQCHVGSQILATGPYRAALKALLGLAGTLAAEGTRLESLDLGGGMGIGYDGGPGLDPAALAAALAPGLRGRPERLLLEPGRWLAGPAGTLLTRVVRLKDTSRRRFVVVDAGMNDLLRPALYSARHRVVPVAPRPGRAAPADVVGPVCETADFLARGARLPRLGAGDLLAVRDAGAYGSSMGSQYNSRPRPAEVLVSRGRAALARRRETPADLVRHEL
ncbi:diaminopimelate decarboxylase [bacterium]|nr:MAG: diaminopimelate decarboxylase [bacterium]